MSLGAGIVLYVVIGMICAVSVTIKFATSDFKDEEPDLGPAIPLVIAAVALFWPLYLLRRAWMRSWQLVEWVRGRRHHGETAIPAEPPPRHLRSVH